MTKKTSLKQQAVDLRVAMLKAYDDYLDARKQMNAFEGKVIDEVGIDKVNAAILQVQVVFADVWSVLNFIQINHQFSTNLLNSHADFIDRLKKAGAIEETKSGKK